MTREEKEHIGKYVLELAKLLEDGCYQQEIFLGVVHIIDEALEQESTTKNDLGVDCIDRQATLDAIIKRLGIKNETYLLEAERTIYQQILAMPSVTPQEPRWIPVSERLPETNIYDRHGPVWKHEVLITGYLSYDDKKKTFINMAFAEDVRNKCVPNTNVTAWMPLPQPYREVEE